MNHIPIKSYNNRIIKELDIDLTGDISKYLTISNLSDYGYYANGSGTVPYEGDEASGYTGRKIGTLVSTSVNPLSNIGEIKLGDYFKTVKSFDAEMIIDAYVQGTNAGTYDYHVSALGNTIVWKQYAYDNYRVAKNRSVSAVGYTDKLLATLYLYLNYAYSKHAMSFIFIRSLKLKNVRL